jgi:hypothetical protein
MNEIPHFVRDDNVLLASMNGRSGDSIEIKLSAKSSANRRFFHSFPLKLLVIPSDSEESHSPGKIHSSLCVGILIINNNIYEPISYILTY